MKLLISLTFIIGCTAISCRKNDQKGDSSDTNPKPSINSRDMSTQSTTGDTLNAVQPQRGDTVNLQNSDSNSNMPE
jgi:hypothetical protein